MRRDRRLAGLLTALALGLATAGVTTPAIAQVAMPDAAQMSGQPLPAGDLPNGTVTVRVVRERMGNNIAGQEVALITPDSRVTAVTDAQGRAEFTSVPPGTMVTAEATVDGERLVSREFAVPSSGGVRVALVAGVATAEAAEAAARAEAAKAPAQPGAVVFGPDTRIVVEFQDDLPTVFYIFSVQNNARTPIDPGRPLVFQLPDIAESPSLVAGPATLASIRDGRLTLTGPFPPGATEFQVAFRVALTSTIRLAQAFPAPVEGVLVAVEKVGGLTLTSPQLSATREGASNGQAFVMGTGGRLAEGQTLSLELTGLPAAPRWPMYLAVSVAGLLAAWAVWAAWQGAPDQSGARKALVAERERLLGAIAALDAEARAKGQLDARTAAKRERLLAAAEQVYADLDALPGEPGTAA